MENYVLLHQLIKEFKLEVVYGPQGYAEKRITSVDVNRPALPLCGYFDNFDPSRIQIVGAVELNYLKENVPHDQIESRFDGLFDTKIPALIVTRGMDPGEECLNAAKRHGIPILRTQVRASDLIAGMTASLHVYLGPQITMHGVFVEVYGEGVLITGDSGTGKSEAAVELIKRGHRLVADDAVEIKRVSDKSLVGSSPEMIRYFMELRGIGIIDARRIFGMGAVKDMEKVDMVIHMEQWDEKKAYDRMGMDDKTTNILGIEVPLIDIPVRPGRNLAVIIEVAAMNHRNKKMGHNAAKELSDRIYENMVAQQTAAMRK